jgi:PucR family transcriptional regulator, purine catabolism regulatory protein
MALAATARAVVFGSAMQQIVNTAAAETARRPDGDEDVAALKAKYQALVEQIPAALYINMADERETTIYVSPQTNSILGIPPEAWFSREWSEHVHPDDRASVDENYQAFLASAREGVDEYRFIRPDGKEIWIHDRVTIIRDEAGTPILVQGVMFDITEQKEAQAILRRQAELMEKVDAVSRRFTDLVLGGAELKRVLETLAAIVGNPVLLEDAAHQLVDFAERSTPLGELLGSWAAHSRIGHSSDSDVRGVTDVPQGEPRCSWTSIRLRNEEWGRIHLLELESPIDEIDRLALDRAAAAIGLSLLSEREAVRLADNARASFISDIWRGRWVSAHDVVARARSLGAEFGSASMVALVVEMIESGDPLMPVFDPSERRRTREAILAAITGALEGSPLTGLSAIVGDRLVGIVGFPAERGLNAALDGVGADVLERISRELPGVTAVIGVSREATPETLRRALTEAGEAAAYGMRMAQGAAIHHFEDLGLHQLLGRLSDGPELSQFVETELGPLLERDAGRRSSLLQTLRAYLESGGSKAGAARALHLERRSVYYRLDRIEELLGKRLDEPATRLRLEVALLGLNLLQQRSSRL